MIVDALRGSKSEKVMQFGLTRFSSYGVLSMYDHASVSEILDALIEKAFLMRTDGKYPVVMLGKNAPMLLSGEMNMTLKHMPLTKAQKANKTKPKTTTALSSPDRSLFEYLRAVRMMLAQTEKVYPFMILTDASLKDLCAKRPHTLGELLNVSGIGEAKKQRYGNDILKAIYEWEAENE